MTSRLCSGLLLVGVGAALLVGAARAQTPCPTTCAGFALAPGGFSNTLPVTATVYSDDATDADARRSDPAALLAGCIGGELRGVAAPDIRFGPVFFSLSIGGDALDVGEAITFRYCLPSAPTPVVDATPSFNADNTPVFSGGQYGSPSIPYRLEIASAALPVELVRFEAVAHKGAVVLRWETASETHNAGFGVEMRVENADAWRELAFVPGAGTTAEAQRYRYDATNLPLGRHAFRLRQMDYDGVLAYSAEIEATVGLAAAFALDLNGPHPVRGHAAFMLTVRDAQHVEADLYDALGRHVSHLGTGAVGAGETTRLDWNASGASPGLYVLRVRGDRFAATRMVVLTR